jgi:DNA-binding NtrC family response regulator
MRMNSPQQIIGEDPQLVRTLHAARLIASVDAPVLISGGRGTGKSLLARFIHASSTRRGEDFRLINCAGVDDQQFPLSVLSRGGGVDGKPSGTLLLKQVGELSAAAQAGVLRFMDAAPAAGPRLIFSSDTDLRLQVEQGVFREDLFFRINVIPLSLPDLNSRRGDVQLLVSYYTQLFSARHKRRSPRYPAETRRLLSSYHWPGNVQELRNFCERMVLLLPGRRIESQNLPREMTATARQASSDAVFSLPDGGIDLCSLEQNLILQALDTARGNRSRAARLLGITRDKLNYRIKKYSLEFTR